MSNQVTNLFCHPTRSAAMIRPNLTHSSFGECGGPRGDGLPRGIAKTRDHEVIGPLSRVPFGRTVQTLRPLATLLESLPGMLNVDSADIVQILSDGILRTLPGGRRAVGTSRIGWHSPFRYPVRQSSSSIHFKIHAQRFYAFKQPLLRHDLLGLFRPRNSDNPPPDRWSPITGRGGETWE